MTGAPTDATRVDPLTVSQIRALPGVFPIWPTASAALGGSPAGLSRPTTYALAKAGDYPVPVFTQGNRRVVRRCDVMAYIGINDDSAEPASPTLSIESAPVLTSAN